VNSDATIYTNLLILERFKLRDGTPLINYDKPEDSPLLQMALPRESSIYPHPEVTSRSGRRNAPEQFRSTEDVQFQRALDWIRAMYQPRPDYPIDYAPPLPRSAQEEVEREAFQPGPVER